MRIWSVAAICAVFFAGCAAYKELTPEPPVTPLERGYIELKEDDEIFQLEKGEKYYIQFPAPVQNDFALVLETNKKWSIESLLTPVFDDKDGPGERIPDEAAQKDSFMVYAVGKLGRPYTWVVENVWTDAELTMRYRYVPRWRYMFENRAVTLRGDLEHNRMDRTQYDAIDDRYSFRGFDFRRVGAQLEVKTRNLAKLAEEMGKLKAIIPTDVLTSTDTAAVKYRQLDDDLTDEVAFQASYAGALVVFEKLEVTRGNTGEFLREAPSFTTFLTNQQHYTERVTGRIRADVIGRLGDAFPTTTGRSGRKPISSPSCWHRHWRP